MARENDNDNQHRRLESAQRRIRDERRALAAALTARGTEPQAGDVYRFPRTDSAPATDLLAEPEAVVWGQSPPLWVVVGRHDQDPDAWLVVQADDVTLAGTPDVPIPADAMVGPLTVRCGLSHWLPVAFLAEARRVAVVEDWHLERIVEKTREIFAFELIGSPGQAETDADPDYQDWMRVAHVHHGVLMERLLAWVPEAVPEARAALGDALRSLRDRMRDALRWEVDVALPSFASGGVDDWRGVTYGDAEGREYRVIGRTVDADGDRFTVVTVTQRFEPRRLMRVALELADGRLLPPGDEARQWHSGEEIMFPGIGNSKEIRALRVEVGEIDEEF